MTAVLIECDCDCKFEKLRSACADLIDILFHDPLSFKADIAVRSVSEMLRNAEKNFRILLIRKAGALQIFGTSAKNLQFFSLSA